MAELQGWGCTNTLGSLSSRAELGVISLISVIGVINVISVISVGFVLWGAKRAAIFQVLPDGFWGVPLPHSDVLPPSHPCIPGLSEPAPGIPVL